MLDKWEINRLKQYCLFVIEWLKKFGDKMRGDDIFQKEREQNIQTTGEMLQMPKDN